MELDQSVGAVLRVVRKQKGLTQEALALEAGAERSYISLIELGRNSPSVRMLYRLCEVLEIPPSSFLAQVEAHLTATSS